MYCCASTSRSRLRNAFEVGAPAVADRGAAGADRGAVGAAGVARAIRVMTIPRYTPPIAGTPPPPAAGIGFAPATPFGFAAAFGSP